MNPRLTSNTIYEFCSLFKKSCNVSINSEKLLEISTRYFRTSALSNQVILSQSKIEAQPHGLNNSLLKNNACAAGSSILNYVSVRRNNIYKVDRVWPKKVKMNLRYQVIYPEDGQYTVKPLKMKKLAGRDPVTGRVVHKKIGGGAKRNFRWIDHFRNGPEEKDSFLIEKVINIQRDPNRSGLIALVGHGNNIRYIMASEHMKAGDLIKTTSHIYRNPVRPQEGDCYPVASLPFGTQVHCIERVPGEGAKVAIGAGTSCTILKKENDRIIVRLPSKRLLSCDPKCMATVGRVSNIHHNKKIVGSAQRKRWLGHRPASGLWVRKDGYCGRKIRKPLPMLCYDKPRPEKFILRLNSHTEGPSREITPSVYHRGRS